MTTTASKRKQIDLDSTTFKSLSVMAAHEGKSLKALIEKKLKEIAEDYEDSLTYSFLSKTRPEGKIILTGEEKEDFEKFLGV